MNPEVRFRVPEHVYQLASQKALELGLKARKGKTGGASELARGALYVFLGLGLPSNLTGFDEFEAVRANRPDTSDEPELLVTVHHRVNEEFRKRCALESRRQIPARATTEFRFAQGELPHFLVPYVALTEKGRPYSTLNLEGSLSPRRHSLGTLVSATREATLEELEECLTQLDRKKKEKAREQAEREEKHQRGHDFLRDWSSKRGSELLRARLAGKFEWLALACEEYARHYLENLGLSDLTRVATTTTLEPGETRFHDMQPQREPQLQTLQSLNRLKELEEPGLSLHVVTVLDRDDARWEGLQVSLELPVPGRIHFLTALIPL